MSRIPQDWVTLYTDASWVHDRQVGAWAVWIRHAGGRHVEGGMVPAYVNCSGGAELSAIFAGIYRTLQLVPVLSKIYVRSDCVAALRLADPDSRLSKNASLRTIQERIRQHLPRAVQLDCKWVQGHAGGDSTQAYINRKVDELATGLVREYLQKEAVKA